MAFHGNFTKKSRARVRVCVCVQARARVYLAYLWLGVLIITIDKREVVMLSIFL